MSPIKIDIDDKVLKVDSWKDVFTKFQIIADNHNHEKFMECVRSRKFSWLRLTEDEKTFEFIPDKTMSAENIRRCIKKVSSQLGISEPTIEVLNADIKGAQ